MRSGPAVTQTKQGVIHDNDVVVVISQAAPGWAQVRGDGFTGFVSTEYLTGPIAAPSTQVFAKLITT